MFCSKPRRCLTPNLPPSPSLKISSKLAKSQLSISSKSTSFPPSTKLRYTNPSRKQTSVGIFFSRIMAIPPEFPILKTQVWNLLRSAPKWSFLVLSSRRSAPSKTKNSPKPHSSSNTSKSLKNTELMVALRPQRTLSIFLKKLLK